jgi:hypothetical protein
MVCRVRAVVSLYHCDVTAAPRPGEVQRGGSGDDARGGADGDARGAASGAAAAEGGVLAVRRGWRRRYVWRPRLATGGARRQVSGGYASSRRDAERGSSRAAPRETTRAPGGCRASRWRSTRTSAERRAGGGGGARRSLFSRGGVLVGARWYSVAERAENEEQRGGFPSLLNERTPTAMAWHFRRRCLLLSPSLASHHRRRCVPPKSLPLPRGGRRSEGRRGARALRRAARRGRHRRDGGGRSFCGLFFTWGKVETSIHWGEKT